MFKLICFDLDGTLIDSVPDLAAGVNSMLSQLSRPNFSEDIVRGWVGNGVPILVQRALSGSVDVAAELTEAELNQGIEFFLRHYSVNLFSESKLYPNVVETLTALKAAGYKLAIITNKPITQTKPVLELAGISDFFDIVLGGDSLAEKKPHPLPLQHCQQQFNLSCDEVLMVGDSKNDIIAAKAAGFSSLGLTYGYNYGIPISESAPNFVADDIGDVLKILGKYL
ncbi:MAG: phosphoglycolate phosphatase [Moritella sp.]|jgi:phosphoglycolate phosphatase